MIETKSQIPLFRGPTSEFEHRSAQLAIWCPFCSKTHWHGWDPADNGRVKTHRWAHCFKDTPLRETGYFVSVLRKKDPGYAAHAVRPGQAIIRRRLDASTQYHPTVKQARGIAD